MRFLLASVLLLATLLPACGDDDYGVDLNRAEMSANADLSGKD